MGRLKGRVLALTAAALLAAGFAAPALAGVADTSWTLEGLKVRGAAAKVGAIKGDGDCVLAFDENGGFALTKGGLPVFSGTFSEDESGKVAFTGVDAASFQAFAAVMVSQSPTGLKKHVAVSAVSVELDALQQPKITSSTKVTETWDSLDLNLGVKINFLFTATMDGPKGTTVTLTNAKGSITLNGKATDPDAGTVTTLPGSSWDLVHAYAISIPVLGTLKDHGTAVLHLGPNATQGLTDGQCLLVSDNGHRVSGTWSAGVKAGAIGITLDLRTQPGTLGAYLREKLDAKAFDLGTAITFFELNGAPSSAKVKIAGSDESLALTVTAKFSFAVPEKNNIRGTFKLTALGSRL